MIRVRRIRAAARDGRAALLAACLVVAVVGSLLSWLESTLLKDDSTAGAAFWPAVAAGVVVLLLVRRAWWLPVVAVFGLAVFGGNLARGSGAVDALAQGVASAVEMVIAAAAVGAATGVSARLPDDEGSLLRDWRDASGLVLAAVVGGLAGTALLGLVLELASSLGSWLTLRGYALSHVTGLLIVVPLLLSAPRSRATWKALVRERRVNAEWAAFMAVSVGITLWLFFGSADRGLSFVAGVPVLLAAERLDAFRATSVLCAACVVAIAGTFSGSGPFADLGSHPSRLLGLQAALLTYCILNLFLTSMAVTRREAYAMLRDSQRLMDMAFDHAPTAMYIASLQPRHVGELVYVNESLCRLLHRRPEELVGQNLRMLAPAADQAVVSWNLQQVAAGTLDHLVRDRTLVRADGREIPTTLAVNVVRPERGHPYLVAQIADQRDRIDAERAMVQALNAEAKAAAELRRVNEARVAVAARLAHDLRSPLTVARAYQELVGTGAAGELTQEQAEMLEVALRNTDKVIDLVDDLVTTASLELEQIDVSHMQTVPVMRLVSSAIDAVARPAQQQNLRIVRPSGEVSAEFFVDPVQFERALVNVLTNAVKYTPAGGRITVDVEADAEGVAIHVTDTGIGIAPEQIERLGEQFFRADTAKEHGIKGIGLGLAVTKAVLSKHDGELRVRSTPGAGSTFTLWVPLRPAQPLRRGVAARRRTEVVAAPQ